MTVQLWKAIQPMAKIFAPVLQMSQVSLYECTRTHVSSGTNLWNLIHKEVIIFIQEKVCENVVCKISILFKPQIWSAKYWPFCWSLNVWMKLKTKKKPPCKWNSLLKKDSIWHKGSLWVLLSTWWRHQMETFSTLLAICAGNSPVPGELPAQRPVKRSFDVFFDLRLNKQLSKQSWGWWFETPSRPL